MNYQADGDVLSASHLSAQLIIISWRKSDKSANNWRSLACLTQDFKLVRLVRFHYADLLFLHKWIYWFYWFAWFTVMLFITKIPHSQSLIGSLFCFSPIHFASALCSVPYLAPSTSHTTIICLGPNARSHYPQIPIPSNHPHQCLVMFIVHPSQRYQRWKLHSSLRWCPSAPPIHPSKNINKLYFFGNFEWKKSSCEICLLRMGQKCMQKAELTQQTC